VNPDPFRRFRRRIAVNAGAGGIAAAAVLATVLSWPAALGLALGAAASAVTFHLRAAEAERLVALHPAAAERRARRTSLGRSACRVAVLALAYVRPEVSFLWTVGGLFAVPVAMAAQRFGAAAPSR